MADPTSVSAAVEGFVDEAVCRRLVIDSGGSLDRIYGRQGVQHLIEKAAAYNAAAAFSPWILLVDLDHRAECAPSFIRSILQTPQPRLCFRVAVRQVEAWLLADQQSIAQYLGVRVGAVPSRPDELENAKQAMIRLASRSRRASVREDMVPAAGSKRQTGPAYSARMIEFARTSGLWKPDVAAANSESLARAIRGIESLVRLGRADAGLRPS